VKVSEKSAPSSAHNELIPLAHQISGSSNVSDDASPDADGVPAVRILFVAVVIVGVGAR
jgi:hypothetical protein